jgi:hypothetical protein
LKAHPAHIPDEIGHTPILHGNGSPDLLAFAGKATIMIHMIHMQPSISSSEENMLATFKDYPSKAAFPKAASDPERIRLERICMKIYIPKGSLKSKFDAIGRLN